MLTGYRLMWMMVLFDLPVGTEAERKSANDFRHFLLDQGFERAQYSVYLRLCSSREQCNTYVRRVHECLPDEGKVDILFFTDKQYENLISFHAGRKRPPRKNPDQFVLF